MAGPQRYHKLSIVSIIFSSLWIFGSSYIYKSIQWTTNNPIFINTTNPCKKTGEIPEIRVRIQSHLPVICPNPNIIMQTLPRAPDKTTLYSNLWIAYDKKSFDTCDVNTTYNFNPRRSWTNKILLRCDQPLTLKEYTIKFSMSGATSKDLEYEPGRYYYFLGTSNGTSDSINNTKGGHCDDKRTGLRLKFKVYLCLDPTDPMCNGAKIGKFICASDYTPSPTGHQSLTTLSSPSSAQNCISTITHECSVPTRPTLGSSLTTGVVSASPSITIGHPASFTALPSASSVPVSRISTIGHEFSSPPQVEDQTATLKELKLWKIVAIVFIVLWIVTVICLMYAYYRKSGVLNAAKKGIERTNAEETAF